MSICLEAFRRRGNERIGRIANRDDHSVDIKREFASRDGYRGASACSVGFSKFVSQAFKSDHVTLFVAENALRVLEHAEFDAFLFGMMNLLASGAEF